jgi:hypothetical protein
LSTSPKIAFRPADLTQWRPPAGVTPLYRRAGESGADTVDAIVAELDQDRPVLTLIRLSRSFDWIGADSVVDPGPTEQPEYLRRHAVVAVGHGEAKAQRADKQAPPRFAPCMKPRRSCSRSIFRSGKLCSRVAVWTAL